MSYKYKKVGERSRKAHLWIAEKVLGRALKGTELVHHVDGVGHNNLHSNLVICPNAAYHRLLHIRTEALTLSGNANYRKCVYCKAYDSPQRMRSHSYKNVNSSYIHYSCNAERVAKQRG